MRSRLCSSACCCVSPGGQQRQHAIRVGGATRRQPGARGAQAELRAVAAGGLGCQPLVEGGGSGMVAGARQLLRRDRRSGGPPRWGVEGQPASTQSRGNDGQKRK